MTRQELRCGIRLAVTKMLEHGADKPAALDRCVDAIDVLINAWDNGGGDVREFLLVPDEERAEQVHS